MASKRKPLRPEDYLALAVAHKPHNTPETNCRTCRMIATIADLTRKLQLAGLEAEVRVAQAVLEILLYAGAHTHPYGGTADCVACRYKAKWIARLTEAIKNRDAALAGGE